MTTQSFVTHADAVTPFHIVGEQIRVLAPVAQTGSYEVFLQTGPEGAGPPPHTHPWDEAYLVLEGQLDVITGDRTVTLSAGDFVHLPRGTTHAFRIRSATAKFVSINSSGGASAFFREVDRETGGLPDLPKLLAVAGRHEVRFVMP